MKAAILLIGLLLGLYNTEECGLFRLERIRWSLSPLGSHGYIEAEYVTVSEIGGYIDWFREATHTKNPEGHLKALSSEWDFENSGEDLNESNFTQRIFTMEWLNPKYPYYVSIFSDQSHEISTASWQDIEGIHHSSRVTFDPVPAKHPAIVVGFLGLGVEHYTIIDQFPPNEQDHGSIRGSAELLHKPDDIARVTDGEIKLHASIKATTPIPSPLIVYRGEKSNGYRGVDESNIEVKDYARDGMYFKEVDFVLKNSSTALVGGEYMTVFFPSATENMRLLTQVLPDDPNIRSFYQHNIVLDIGACNFMALMLDGTEKGVKSFKLDAGWDNCIHCTVSGYPNPSVMIYRDGKPLNSTLGPNESFSDHLVREDRAEAIFLMEPVGESVAGRFACVGQADDSPPVTEEFLIQVDNDV